MKISLYRLKVVNCWHCYLSVDGGYTEWSEFSECTVTCGGGVRERTRECSNPAPENNGIDCEKLGPAKESDICNNEACPTEPPQDLG